ncbi:MAG: hypothetical protein LBM07_02275 [Culturomica sp.]|jgi:hypothetical protein|nr:hypothetical protein [Culturomica sp.]
MEKLVLKSFTDKNYSREYKSPITLQINPSEIRFEKSIKYDRDRQMGALGGASVFENYGEQTCSFNILLDATGVLSEDEDTRSVQDIVDKLEAALYGYNSEAHRPPYVMVVWGVMIFKGQLSKMETNYTMFSSTGEPMRAKLSFTFCGFTSDEEERKKAGKSSPDMSHLITIRAGETLASVCNRIYGDSLLVDEVATINGLNGFRNIKAGTTLIFPHLKKIKD